MTFISFTFLFFFIFIIFLYFTIPHKYRWFLLLVASCIFYISFIPLYLFVIFLLIFIDYYAGIFIEKSAKGRKIILLTISIVSMCAVLFVFKYHDFFVVNFENLAIFLNFNYSAKLLKLVLPVGLSFHTFQSLSYVIEVYRGNQKAEKNLGIYALYVMFFPQLMAGPIERPYNMLHQFYEKHNFNFQRVSYGLRQMLWGVFLKVVIADRAANVVNMVYDSPMDYHGFPLIIATILFSFQIFCDFAGYSAIAIGAAKVLGFELMTNFHRPYFAKSISEFWHRWHISLSTWFRDYIYIPLGGNRVSTFRWIINIMITFILSGLWHGANWTFIVWGALHGFYLLILDPIKKFIKNENIQTAITFSAVCFAWIFFRANTLSHAIYIVNNLFTDLSGQIYALLNVDFDVLARMVVLQIKILNLSITAWISLVIAIFTMIFIQKLQERYDLNILLDKINIVWRWIIYYTVIYVIFYFSGQGGQQFIYFQF